MLSLPEHLAGFGYGCHSWYENDAPLFLLLQTCRKLTLMSSLDTTSLTSICLKLSFHSKALDWCIRLELSFAASSCMVFQDALGPIWWTEQRPKASTQSFANSDACAMRNARSPGCTMSKYSQKNCRKFSLFVASKFEAANGSITSVAVRQLRSTLTGESTLICWQ